MGVNSTFSSYDIAKKEIEKKRRKRIEKARKKSKSSALSGTVKQHPTIESYLVVIKSFMTEVPIIQKPAH